MTVTVNTHSEQEELDLITFLESKKYDFHTGVDLTEEQMNEVLRRDKDLSEGKTTSQPWSEILGEFDNVYR